MKAQVRALMRRGYTIGRWNRKYYHFKRKLLQTGIAFHSLFFAAALIGTPAKERLDDMQHRTVTVVAIQSRRYCNFTHC